jgi:hypothetical protein
MRCASLHIPSPDVHDIHQEPEHERCFRKEAESHDVF